MAHPAGEGGHRIAVDARGAPGILARAASLELGGRPFAMATVVAIERPTSARPGARGLVHPDGSIEGWVGGSCAQPVVVREALRALGDGQPRLLRLSRTGGEGRRGDGVIEYVMTCHSGGTLEIFVEPHLPAAELWVIGATPIAQALARAGAVAGYRVSVIDPVADPEVFGPDIAVQAGMDLAALEPTSPPWVIVASQGGWDEEALEAILARDVAYVGLVASPARATAVREYLRDAGVAAERLAALRAPAGLDLGAQTPAEVATAILAELVQVRRGRAPFVAAPGPAAVAGADDADVKAPHPHQGHGMAAPEGQPETAVDPVCGMEVTVATARHIAQDQGTIYYFCSVGCRARFVRDPASYVAATTAAEPERERS